MLRFEKAKENGECKLTLETPYKKIKTDSYAVFIKKHGRNHIEINNLDLDDIKDFIEKLEKILKDNEDFFKED